MFEQSAGANVRHRRMQVGEAVEVTVVAVGREAVFVDLGGKQEGFFERADLMDAEGNVRVAVGARISAVVASIEKATGQVKLSPVVVRGENESSGGGGAVAPSEAVGGGAGPLLVEGARVKGKVTGIERYGVFVQIAGTSGRSGRGLVPVSESGTPRGADLKKHFALGQEVETKILSIDETGKIRLSIGALSSDDERGLYEAYQRSQSGGEAPPPSGAKAKPGEKAKPAPRNLGTLGDLLPSKVAPKKAAAAPKAAASAPPVRKVAKRAKG
jgi:small subunit ribosomal protein S1